MSAVYNEFIPKYTNREEKKRTREIITAAEWNELWNLNSAQGDHSEEYLYTLKNYLFGINGMSGKVAQMNSSINAFDVVIEYQKDIQGQTIPTGEWLPTIPTVNPAEYLWTRFTYTLSDGTVTVTPSAETFEVTVDSEAYKLRAVDTGVHIFTYSDSEWVEGSSKVILSDWGITVTGTPSDGDTITGSYQRVTRTAYSIAYRGQDGSSTGDMTKGVYDRNENVSNAGGIEAWAALNYGAVNKVCGVPVNNLTDKDVLLKAEHIPYDDDQTIKNAIEEYFELLSSTKVNGYDDNTDIAPLANNLYTTDSQVDNDTFLQRTTGGSADLGDGPAYVQSIRGNCVVTGKQAESIVGTCSDNIAIQINEAQWRQTVLISGTYTFTYANGSWDIDPSTKGILVAGIVQESASITSIVPTLTASIDFAVWKAACESAGMTPGPYTFKYNGPTWSVGERSGVVLSEFGITITSGTPVADDEFTVLWVSATESASIQVAYTKKEQGVITVANPRGLTSVLYNQFNASNGYAKVLGNNKYRVLPSDTVLTFSSTPTGAQTSVVTDSNGMFTPEANGYIHASGTEILICLVWSGIRNKDEWEAYSENTLMLPLVDADGTPLPTQLYGMPKVANVADELDFVNKQYIQRIQRIAYSEAALTALLAAHPSWVEDRDYMYDNSWIYYILYDTAIIYTLADTVTNEYEVSDFGTEWFTNTTVPLSITIKYSFNLKDKLRRSGVTDYEATILSANWSVAGPPFTQDVEVPGILDSDTPIVDLVVSDDFDTAVTQMEEYGNIYRITTDVDKITVYASDKPEHNLNIILKVAK